MKTFHDIRLRAEKRKGGAKVLDSLLVPLMSSQEFRAKHSSYFLSLMSLGIFQSGFVWKVVEKKWPEFETAFLNFDPQKLLKLKDDDWDRFAENKAIVRNPIKIRSIRENAKFILDIEEDKGCSFAQILDDWDSSELVSLWECLKKRGSRLGGMTGQYFLRRAGKDAFILSKDVVTSLQEMGMDIKDNPSSKRELLKIQNTFNAIHRETKLPYTHISKILAYGSGENYPVETIVSETKRFEENA